MPINIENKIPNEPENVQPEPSQELVDSFYRKENLNRIQHEINRIQQENITKNKKNKKRLAKYIFFTGSIITIGLSSIVLIKNHKDSKEIKKNTVKDLIEMANKINEECRKIKVDDNITVVVTPTPTVVVTEKPIQIPTVTPVPTSTPTPTPKVENNTIYYNAEEIPTEILDNLTKLAHKNKADKSYNNTFFAKRMVEFCLTPAEMEELISKADYTNITPDSVKSHANTVYNKACYFSPAFWNALISDCQDQNGFIFNEQMRDLMIIEGYTYNEIKEMVQKNPTLYNEIEDNDRFYLEKEIDDSNMYHRLFDSPDDIPDKLVKEIIKKAHKNGAGNEFDDYFVRNSMFDNYYVGIQFLDEVSNTSFIQYSDDKLDYFMNKSFSKVEPIPHEVVDYIFNSVLNEVDIVCSDEEYKLMIKSDLIEGLTGYESIDRICKKNSSSYTLKK